MAVDGNYKVEVSMPEGKRSLSIKLKSEGGKLSGTIDGPFGEHDFSGGSVSDNSAAWTVMLKHGSDNAGEENPDGGLFRKIGRFISDSLSDYIMELPSDQPESRSVTELPVEFSAEVTGDKIKGEMKFGDYATGTFEGVRAFE